MLITLSYRAYVSEDPRRLANYGIGVVNGVLLYGPPGCGKTYVDSALGRSGRFDERVEVPPPDADARREILQIHLQQRLIAEEIDWDTVVELTEGYAASDLKLLAEDAAQNALRDDSPVTQEHFEIAVWEPQSSIADWGGKQRYQQTEGTTDLGYTGQLSSWNPIRQLSGKRFVEGCRDAPDKFARPFTHDAHLRERPV